MHCLDIPTFEHLMQNGVLRALCDMSPLSSIIYYFKYFDPKVLCQVPADILIKNISGGNSRVFAEYGTKMGAGKAEMYLCSKALQTQHSQLKRPKNAAK